VLSLQFVQCERLLLVTRRQNVARLSAPRSYDVGSNCVLVADPRAKRVEAPSEIHNENFVTVVVATGFSYPQSYGQAPSTRDQDKQARAPKLRAQRVRTPRLPSREAKHPGSKHRGSQPLSSGKRDKKITISGCVARQPESVSAAASAPSVFMLNNAAAAGMRRWHSVPRRQRKTYRLDGTEAMLSPHVVTRSKSPERWRSRPAHRRHPPVQRQRGQALRATQAEGRLRQDVSATCQ